MENLVNEIKEAFSAFVAEAEKDGNKAAATRARVISVKLDKLLKQYRKETIETAKQ